MILEQQSVMPIAIRMISKIFSSSIKAALLFASVTFFIEMLDVLYLFYKIKDIVRFKGLLSDTGIAIHLPVIYFFARVFLLHFILGLIAEIYLYVFNIKKRSWMYGFLYIYVFLLLALRTPQIFDEFDVIQTLLVDIRLFKYPGLPTILVYIMGSLLVYKCLELIKLRSWKIFAAVPLICALAIFLSKNRQMASAMKVHTEYSILKQTPHPHVIVITTDSLRGDVNFLAHPRINSSFKKFLQKSFHFQNVTSPLPQTHVAMTSILTGKSPQNLKIRTNLSHPAPANKNILDQGTILDLKNAGFETTMLMDVMEYSNHRPGQAIEKIKAPTHSIANVFISTFFKSKTVFGLFNNSFGHLFLPEIKDNTSFPYAYHVNHFTQKTLDELNSVTAKSRSQFLYLHTCAVHWPGIFPYPYYPQEDLEKVPQIPFSYTSKFLNLEQMSAEQWATRSQYNSHIYTKGIDMLIEEYLNPVFTNLDQQGFLDNSIVILLSDHGENFWNPTSKYPYIKKPEHGGSFIFGADSEQALLHMSFPLWQGREIREQVGLIDIMPSVLDYLKIPPSTESQRGDGASILGILKNSNKKERMYYSETGLWPFRTFSFQFVTTPLTDLAPMLSYDDKYESLYIQDSHLPAIILQKQRVLNWRDYRYIVFPTAYGFQDFLCDRKKDPQCNTNIKKPFPKVTAKMRKEMLYYMQPDFMNESSLLGPCNTKELAKNAKEEPTSRHWHLLFSANTCINKWHDYRSGMEILRKILKENSEPSTVATKARQQLFTLCSNRLGLEDPETVTFIKREYLKTSNMNPKCAQVLNLDLPTLPETQTDEGNEKDDERMTPSEIIQHNINFVHLNESFYPQVNIQKRQAILEEMAIHPARERFEQMFNTAKLYHMYSNNSEHLKAELDSLYQSELNYQMTGSLVSYYYAYYMSLYKKSENLVFIDAVKRMDEASLPDSFFYSILGRLQALTENGEVLNLLSFRNLFFKYPYLTGIPVYDLETSFFKQRLQDYLCKNKKTADLCSSLKHRLRADSKHLFIQKNFPARNNLSEESLKRFALSYKENFYNASIYF